jgi:hypothetical protein
VAALHLAAGKPATAVGPEGGGTEGICVKILKVLGFAVQKDCSLFCELVQHLVKSIKNRKKSKNNTPNFAVLSITRTTTFSK